MDNMGKCLVSSLYSMLHHVCANILATTNLPTKFELPNFTRSQDRTLDGVPTSAQQ